MIIFLAINNIGTLPIAILHGIVGHAILEIHVHTSIRDALTILECLGSISTINGVFVFCPWDFGSYQKVSYGSFLFLLLCYLCCLTHWMNPLYWALGDNIFIVGHSTGICCTGCCWTSDLVDISGISGRCYCYSCILICRRYLFSAVSWIL